MGRGKWTWRTKRTGSYLFSKLAATVFWVRLQSSFEIHYLSDDKDSFLLFAFSYQITVLHFTLCSVKKTCKYFLENFTKNEALLEL